MSVGRAIQAVASPNGDGKDAKWLHASHKRERMNNAAGCFARGQNRGLLEIAERCLRLDVEDVWNLLGSNIDAILIPLYE